MATAMKFDPLTRACPACFVRIGQPCTRPANVSRTPVRWFHHVRTEPAPCDVCGGTGLRITGGSGPYSACKACA